MQHGTLVLPAARARDLIDLLLTSCLELAVFRGFGFQGSSFVRVSGFRFLAEFPGWLRESWMQKVSGVVGFSGFRGPEASGFRV